MDRFPESSKRIINLSEAAARKLGFVKAGTAQVELEPIPDSERWSSVFRTGAGSGARILLRRRPFSLERPDGLRSVHCSSDTSRGNVALASPPELLGAIRSAGWPEVDPGDFGTRTHCR